MPRDNDKNNDSRGRRDRPSGGKGRSGAARGPERKFGGDKKFSRGAPDRGPRKDFGDRPARGESKPWQKREAGSPDRAERSSRPPRDGARNFDRPKFDKPRYDKPREDRPQGDRPRSDRPFRERPKFDRPRRDRDGDP